MKTDIPFITANLESQDFYAELRQTYFSELPTRIDDVENSILALDQDASNQAEYQELLRKVHGLKGSAGTYGFYFISQVCHQFEDLLLKVNINDTNREKVTFDQALAYVDLLRRVIESFKNGNEDARQHERDLEKLLVPENNAQLRVALVTPSKTISGLCLLMLQKPKYETTVFDDGLQALQDLLIKKFDLLITGNEMKALTGPALVSALRLSKSKNRDIDIVYLSSKSAMFDWPEKIKPDYSINWGPKFADELEVIIANIRAKQEKEKA